MTAEHREVLKRILRYDPETGLFTYIVNRGRLRKVGDVAGNISKKSNHVGGGYRVIPIRAKNLRRDYATSRLAWFYVYGTWPTHQIDHINGMKYDNRAENLRAVSLMENNRNVALPKNNASGIMGVRWNKLTKKWQAQIGSAGKSIHLGSFADLAEATAVRKAAELAYGFHANHGRAAPAT